MVPKTSRFLETLGITHEDILKNCNGTLKLGIKFDGFNLPDKHFCFPFGLGEHQSFNTSSIMQMINTEKVSSKIMDYPDLATHFRTTEMTEYMDTLISRYGNLHILRNTATLADLAGTYDLLVDCTGFRRAMSTWDDNFKNMSDIIPNNRAYTYRHTYTDRAKQCKPYSFFKAMDYGWIWHIPLGDQLALGYVHDNQYDVKDDYVKYLTDMFGVEIETSQIKEINWTTGRNHVHLKDNIVAMGLASTFIEPLESTGLYLVTNSLEKLSAYIDGKLDAQGYNDGVNEDFDSILNFIVAHYKYSRRDNAYWNHFKDLPVENYKESEIFPLAGWNFVLHGFDENVPLPKEAVDPKELINIHRGTPYHEWIQNASNFT